MAPPKKSSKKKIKEYVKFQAPAGQANPSPPLGPVLGQRGLNIMDFCKAFNDVSVKEFAHGTPLGVVMTVYEDRTFDFILKTPPATWYILNALKRKSGSKTPSITNAEGLITEAQLRDIAEAKMKDLNANTVEAAMRIVAGSARSMGVAVPKGYTS